MNSLHRTRKPKRRTFAEICESERIPAAKRAFRRAIMASKFRKAARRRRKGRVAASLAITKVKAVRRALALAPELIRITLDSDFQIGLLSVRFAGVGRVHLPPATELPNPSPVADSVRLLPPRFVA